MKAVGYYLPQDITHNDSLQDIEADKPIPGQNDLLVNVQAVSVNPVDYKIRKSRSGENGSPVILGWDASGIVEDFGSAVTGFKKGDRVFYAGDLTRQGSNAEYQAVDYRIVGKAPQSLDFTQAAALPLTTLTAYEGLFEQLKVPDNKDFKILIIGGAGGVGSIAIQLLKILTKGKVYATAGRGVSQEWVRKSGADGVIDRTKPLREEMKRLDVQEFDFIFSTTNTKDYISQFPDIIRAFGSICLIDDPDTLDITPLKSKSVSVSWEFMFAKSMHGYKMESQGDILNKISSLVDQEKIRSTAATKLQGLKAENFREAHKILESGTSLGKIVIGF